MKIGDELIIFAGNTCRTAVLESIEIDGHAARAVISDGVGEVGLRLNKRASMPGQLRRLQIPEETSEQMPLELEDAMATTADAADTDLADVPGQGLDADSDTEEEAATE